MTLSRSNYDLFVNDNLDLIVTFSWHVIHNCDLYDLLKNDNLDLIVTFLWHVIYNCDLFLKDIVSRSNCDLYMNNILMTLYADLIVTFQ